MTTLKIKDADGATKHVAATGIGTADDPIKTQQSITGAVTINQPLPAGENNIGKVEVTAMPPLSVGDINVEVGEVAVSNFPASFQVSNFPVTQTIAGSISVSNFPASFQVSNLPTTQAIAGNVGVTNFPAGFEISNFPATQAVTGSVGVSNFPTSFQVSNLPATQTIVGSVGVTNFPASFQVSNFPTTQAISGTVSLGTTENTKLTEIRDRLPASPVANITPITTDGTSGDKTILAPTSGKALRISSLCLTMASATAVTLKKSSTAISGVMTISDLVADFPQPIGLAIDQIFVINIGSAVAVNGFITWWEA